MRHLINLLDLSREEILSLLAQAAKLKARHMRGQGKLTMAGKVLGLVFEKPSLRTRVSFEAAMAQLGGSSVFLNGNDAGLGTRETIPDFARTMSQYVDGVVLRTFSHGTVESFAAHASVPVINGLSDYFHPCQALADLLTVQEFFGDLAGRTIVFVGDGNNVARSLAICCGMLGVRFILSAPTGYGFDHPFLELCRERVPQGEPVEIADPCKAVKEADVIYTDVWASMGQEAEKDARRRAFASYQVNEKLLQRAPASCVVMHCLPARRGEEITSEVMEGERCIAFQQAGNRLHAQKALLQWLLVDECKERTSKTTKSNRVKG